MTPFCMLSLTCPSEILFTKSLPNFHQGWEYLHTSQVTPSSSSGRLSVVCWSLVYHHNPTKTKYHAYYGMCFALPCTMIPLSTTCVKLLGGCLAAILQSLQFICIVMLSQKLNKLCLVACGVGCHAWMPLYFLLMQCGDRRA